MQQSTVTTEVRVQCVLASYHYQLSFYLLHKVQIHVMTNYNECLTFEVAHNTLTVLFTA